MVDTTVIVSTESLMESAEVTKMMLRDGRMTYTIRYSDGTERHLSEETYKKIHATVGMNIGVAISFAKKGCRVTRAKWQRMSGAIQWLAYQPGYPVSIKLNDQTLHAHHLPDGAQAPVMPYLQAHLWNGALTNYIPTMDDLLAEDWVIIDSIIF